MSVTLSRSKLASAAILAALVSGAVPAFAADAPAPAAPVAAPAAPAPAAPAAAKPSARFPVIGYYPSWTGGSPTEVQWSKLTHVFYSFINPTAAGGLTEANLKLLSELTALGRKHGVKVGVAIGGWNNGNTTDWESMARKPKTRQRFVKNVMEFVELNRLDAVDIDWEYPNAASSADFSVMMKELGDALHKKGKLLSTAVVGKNEEFIAYIKPEVFGYIDYLNIMAYDFNWNKPGHSHSAMGATDTALTLWLARGCPKEKVVLGVPFYGRNPEITYKELVLKDKQAHTKDESGSFFYNGIPTIRKKTEMALQRAGGVMIWEVTQDTYDSTSLLSAIHSTIENYRGQAAK